MQQFFSNHYVRLATLTIGIAAIIFFLLTLIASAIGLGEFPVSLLLGISVLGAGLLVYKYIAGRMPE